MSKAVKILVVDDFGVVRLAVKKILKELGFEQIEEASDGRSALAKIEAAYSAKAPYQMVFCDWNMPDISGLQVVEACRKKPELADLPIVLITAEGDQKSVVKALEAGATDYILKPVAPDLLQKCVTKILKN